MSNDALVTAFDPLAKTNLFDFILSDELYQLKNTQTEKSNITLDEYENKYHITIPEPLIGTWKKNTWVYFNRICNDLSKEHYARNEHIQVHALMLSFEDKYTSFDLYSFLKTIESDSLRNLIKDQKTYFEKCFRICTYLMEDFNEHIYQEIFYFDAFGKIDSVRFILEDKPAEEAIINLAKELIEIKSQYSECLSKFDDPVLKTSHNNNKPKSEEITQESFLDRYGLEKISYQQALERMGVESLFSQSNTSDGGENSDDYEEENEDDTEITVFFADQDITIPGNFSIPKNYGHTLVVVNGDLTVYGYLHYDYYVTGNLETYTRGDKGVCLGKERILHYQSDCAEDHEILRVAAKQKISAPFFFSWFYDLNAYEFDPKTIIIALYEADELYKYKTTNPIFRWHDAAFALKEDAIYTIEREHYDSLFWRDDVISQYLAKNESPFRDGFSVDCLVLCDKARELWCDRQYEMAFLYYREATIVSPTYYPAWKNAAELLVNNKAYAQAIPYLEKALETSPTKVYYAKGDALASYIFCLIKLGETDRAKELAETQAIPENKKSIQNDYDLALIYRLAGEIECIERNYEKALEYLTLAYEKYHGFTFAICWLQGLAYYKLGNTEESTKWFEQSKRKHSNPKHYNETESLSFFNGDNKLVDWESKSITTAKPKPRDQDYWNTFFIKYNKIDQIPEKFITQEMVDRIYSEGSEIYGASNIYIDRYTFNHIPQKYVTRDIALRAFNFTVTPEQFSRIPTSYLDKDFFLKAKEYKLENVSKDIVDCELCLDAVSKDYYNLKHVPEHFRSEELIAISIARGAIEYLPKIYQTTEYIKKGISICFNALKKIPNHLMGIEAYNHAKSLYSSHPQWELIDKEHRFDGDFNQDSINKTWAYNWTEEFILKVFSNHKYINQLPAEYFTPRIIRLKLEQDPRHIKYMPRSVITQEFSALACKNFQNIGMIPTKFRNQLLLDNIAYSKKGECEYWLHQLPIELRTEENCYVYLSFSLDMEPVPHQHYIPLMDRFLALKEKQKQYYDETYIHYRAIGHLFNNNLAEALKDFSLAESLEKSRNTESSRIADAIYYQGYIHYLQNQNDAKSFYQQSQEMYERLSTNKYYRLTTPYEKFSFSKVYTDVSDWEALELGEQLQNIYNALDFGFFDDGMQEITDLENTLRKDNNTHLVDWIRIWSFKLQWLFHFEKTEEAIQLYNNTLKKIDTENLNNNIKDDSIILEALRNMKLTFRRHTKVKREYAS